MQPMKSRILKSLLVLACATALAGCTAINTRVVINAPANKVRALVVDYGSYPSWNPFVVKVVGDMSAGKDVRVTVHPVGHAEITGTGHVLASDPDRIAWSGRLGFPGVFSGVHTFLIEADGPSRTVFSNNEKMRGLSILFFDFKPTQAAFVAMNQALKQRAEAR
jgi:hypothetical protein